MRALTRSWINKAEGDYQVATNLLQSWQSGFADSVCFHSQQCAERYLKGRLAEVGVPFQKAPNLPALLALLLPFDPHWQALGAACQNLEPYGLEILYPGRNATKREALKAQKFTKSIRREARLALGLKP